MMEERTYLYERVRKLKLEDAVKKANGGRNYTLASNKLLKEVVASADNVKNPVLETPEADQVQKTDTTAEYDMYTLLRLVEVLKRKHVLLNSEVRYIETGVEE